MVYQEYKIGSPYGDLWILVHGVNSVRVSSHPCKDGPDNFITVNRVPIRIAIPVKKNDITGEWQADHGCSYFSRIQDWTKGQDVSFAARKKMREYAEQVAAQWSESHEPEMLQGELATVEQDISRAQSNAQEAQETADRLRTEVAELQKRSLTIERHIAQVKRGGRLHHA